MSSDDEYEEEVKEYIPYNPKREKEETQFFKCVQEMHSEMQEYIYQMDIPIFDKKDTLHALYKYLE